MYGEANSYQGGESASYQGKYASIYSEYEILRYFVLGGGHSGQQQDPYYGYQKPDVSQAARLAKQHARQDDDDDDDDDSKYSLYV